MKTDYSRAKHSNSYQNEEVNTHYRDQSPHQLAVLILKNIQKLDF